VSILREQQMVVTVTLSTSIDSSVEAPGFARGGVVPGRLLAREASGKGINLARYLKALDVDAKALAFVGEHEVAFYEEVLGKEGIPHRLVPVPGATRNNITISDPVTGLETHIRHPGLAVEKHHIAKLREMLGQEVPRDSWVVFSGGAPPGLTTGEYQELIEEAKRNAARVAVDTSGPYLQAAVQLNPGFIKPNAEELSELLGDNFRSPGEIGAASLRLLSCVKHVVTSCGAEGAVYACEEGVWHGKVYVDQKNVKGSVGCGDAVVAGFISAEMEGLGAMARLARAVACGSAAALWPSAGHLSAQEVWKLERSADIRDLSESIAAEGKKG